MLSPGRIKSAKVCNCLGKGGARGGFDGPVAGLYRALAEELIKEGICSLRLDDRFPGYLPSSVMDTLATISFLKGAGFCSIALVGYSFGGSGYHCCFV